MRSDHCPTRIAVITLVSGRHEHLRRQRSALASGVRPPDLHVVVSMGDPGIEQVLDDGSGLETRLLRIPVPEGGLPLAQSRNAGVAAAIDDGAGLLVLLDVDCLPGRDAISRYAAAAATPDGADGLLAGAVTYLPPAPDGGWAFDSLTEFRSPHPARPVPPDGEMVPGEHRLFWSLSFALTPSTWTRIGGFCPEYVGYGGEDTDFAMTAKAAEVSLWWVGGADAYHQHHPVSSPPVEHLTDILRNGALFRSRWGAWPMEGWMEDFERLHLVVRKGPDWIRARPTRLVSIPASHPYVDAVRPPSAVAVLGRRVSGWEPDPLLTPTGLQRAAERIDVIHLHFGYDHLSVEAMSGWLAAIREEGIPLVVTVHDLRNPHHRDPELHDAHLRLLMGQADAVLTLTAGAAAEIEARYRRSAQVLPHPSLLDRTTTLAGEPSASGLVVMHLKSLRRNIADPGRLVAATLMGVRAARETADIPGRLRVDVHPDVLDRPELRSVRELAGRGELELSVHERFSDAELQGLLLRAHACVLPYQFGTHSGWLELCRDLGTRVIAPTSGHFGGADGQWDEVISYDNDETSGLGEASLSAAVSAALESPPPSPADRGRRLIELRDVKASHADVYARLARS